MLFVDFNAGGEDYKLRLTTRNVIQLEKKIGCNPLMIFGDGSQVPTITVMATVLWASLQQYQHNISEEKAYGIFDAWLDDGHSVQDFVQVIVDVYRASGLITAQAEDEEEKN